MIEAKGHNGSVIFDGQFVTIVRSGALARMSIGKGEKRIPISSITAVRWKPAGPLVNGFIHFTVPGGTEKRSAFGSQTNSAGKDENSVIFIRKQMADFEKLRAAVESAILEGSRTASSQQPTQSIGDQIAQLAALRDKRILTDEEFERKKADLLSRM